MKFLTNGPREVNKYTIVPMVQPGQPYAQAMEEAIQKERAWRADKIIGPPQATEKWTVERLRAAGMIGIYAPDDDEAAS